jgi:hypothetical protein
VDESRTELFTAKRTKESCAKVAKEKISPLFSATFAAFLCELERLKAFDE